MWQRKLITILWPARFIFAKACRLPGVGWVTKRLLFEGDFLSILPSSRAVKKKEKVVLPGIVVDHFIEKSSYRFAMNACICRDANKCANYPVDIGCLFMGEAARQINPALGRPVTREEARALQRRVEEAGLINMVGKNRLDKVWLGVNPVEKLLTVCRCCECCCLWQLITVLPDSIAGMVHKMEGVEVAVTGDCRGCGTCTRHCFVQAVGIQNGRAVIDRDLCRGCGRCVLNCPREAIELTFRESDYFQKCLELVSRLEEEVDVTTKESEHQNENT